MRKVVANPKKVAVSIIINVVRVDFILGDRYAARVMYEDLVERLRAGEALAISVEPASPKQRGEQP